MNLAKIVNPKFLQYHWQEHKGYPYSSLIPLRKRNSRQGWIALGDPTHQVPTGAQVASAALDVDGTRGYVNFWTPWAPAIGAAWSNIVVAVWKSTDAAPAAFDPANPANALAGRLGLPVAAATSAATVATTISGLILAMLTTQGHIAKFLQLGGSSTPNMARADLGNGTVALVSPRLWLGSRLAQMGGAFAAAMRTIEHPATVVPIMNAGVRPAPWVIVGNATPGLGIDRGPAEGGSPEPTVLLRTAGNYEILAKTGVTNIPTSHVTGKVGVSPAAASTITGLALTLDGGGQFSTSAQVVGHVEAADYAVPTPANLTQAVLDMQAAYTDAAGRAPDVTELNAGLLNSQTLTPGVYKWSTGVTISGDITLHGSSSDQFIFEIAGVLSLAANKKIVLTGGLLPANVIWQVAGNVALGVATTFNGTILCLTDITIGAGATMVGKCLAQTAVNLSSTSLN